VEFRAQTPFNARTMAKLEEGAFTLFDSSNERPYFGIRKSIQRMRLIGSMQLGWSPDDSVYSGTDAGIARKGPAAIRVTDGGTGYGALDASSYSVRGTAGATRTCAGAISGMTITGGIVTAVTCP
jgi:hypothetical protein